MYLLIISFIVANCVLTVFNKDNDDDDDVGRSSTDRYSVRSLRRRRKSDERIRQL